MNCAGCAILAVMGSPRNVTARLRFRVYVSGVLADEAWVDAMTPGAHATIAAVSHAHAATAAEAAEHGLPWLVEIYDPDRPEGGAYTRWGTDTAGMTEPAEVPDGKLGETVLALFDGTAGQVDDGGRR
jgi:hypothetical protein